MFFCDRVVGYCAVFSFDVGSETISCSVDVWISVPFAVMLITGWLIIVRVVFTLPFAVKLRVLFIFRCGFSVHDYGVPI